jgi:hypothetical protein
VQRLVRTVFILRTVDKLAPNGERIGEVAEFGKLLLHLFPAVDLCFAGER